MWPDDDKNHSINMEMFVGSECKYCKNSNCVEPLCIYKKIRDYAKDGLDHEDENENLACALESIENLTDFLIDGR